MTASAYAE